MNRKEIIRKINEYTINNNEQEAINLLCEMIETSDYEKYKDLIFILIDSFQLYGYLNKIGIDEFQKIFNDYSHCYKLDSYKGMYIDHFNSGQLSLIETIDEKDKIIISAPTSFGKTSLIIEYILQNNDKLNNIIFIVPTNSLIEELYIKFMKINRSILNKYNISINTKICEGRSIKILTPEKFLSFYEYTGFNRFDLVVMDETYKIEDKVEEDLEVVDNRSLKFRKVLEIIGKLNSKTIMLSPYTYTKEESMIKYMNKYGVNAENRRKKYVEHEYHNLYNTSTFNEFFSHNTIRYNEYGKMSSKVISILKELSNEENIVYINSPSKACELISSFEEDGFIANLNVNDRYKSFLKHLEDNYLVDNVDEWYVVKGLRLGFGVYVASMPRYIKREIVNLFNEGIINNLIVTTAFIEGVNSAAKNIIITSEYTGGNVKLNNMSLLNIAGRAGRFGKNNIGHVFFISNDVYEKVKIASETGVTLSNPNYTENTSKRIRSDYEIEMMDDQYLNNYEMKRKKEIQDLTENLKLNYNELKNVCLSVPIEWKIKLYYFFEQNKEEIDSYKECVENIVNPDNEKILTAMTEIFNILRKVNIPISSKRLDIYPFKKNGEFLWGKFYQQHVNGNIKKILIYKKMYILQESRRLSDYFFQKTWMRKYFDKKGLFLDNKLYEGTFKFISDIIEYKIPYYLGFFVGMFKYYIEKNKIEFEDSNIDLDNVMIQIENIGIDEKLISFHDFGFPKETIDKIANLDKPINEYNIDELNEFDNYEKIMIEDYLSLMN